MKELAVIEALATTISLETFDLFYNFRESCNLNHEVLLCGVLSTCPHSNPEQYSLSLGFVHKVKASLEKAVIMVVVKTMRHQSKGM